MKLQSALLISGRSIAFICVCGWGWYVAAMMRTSGWGYHNPLADLPLTLMAFSLMVVPFIFIPVYGLRWRHKLTAIAGITLLSLLSSEAFARLQEYQVLQRLGDQPTSNYSEKRWQPFEHHNLGYMNGQWWGCD